MPYKFEKEKLKLNLIDDKRRKLTDEQKEEITKKYATGLYSQRQLAKEYCVSRRLITFIIDPIKLEKSKENHLSKKYYNKDKHREYMQRHRQHKKELYEKGKLIKEE